MSACTFSDFLLLMQCVITCLIGSNTTGSFDFIFIVCLQCLSLKYYDVTLYICSQLNVQVQWCMTVGFGDQSAKAEKS